MIRLGLIGCGAWGWRYVPSALEADNCAVTHIAGARLEDGLAGLERVPAREWRRLLDAPVDAFVVATPPDSHEDICVDLLAAGRPVMVEKPLALSLRAASEIADASRRSGAPMLVAHQHLFAPAYEKLRETCSHWDRVSVVSAGGGTGPVRPGYSALWDYGAHDVSMFLGLTARRFSTDFVSGDRKGGNFRMLLEAAEGRSGLLRVWNDGEKRRVFSAMNGTNVLEYDDLSPSPLGKLRLNGTPVPVAGEKPLTCAVRAFADAVAKGGTDDWRFDPMLGVEVTRILARADEHMEERHGDD